MSELALQLIAENKKTRATFLDLGNCGLTRVPEEIGELVWLESLLFADGWLDNSGQRHKSQNTAAVNNITQLNNSFHLLKKLKKLWLNGSFSNKFDLTDLSPLAGLSSLQLVDITTTSVSDLSPLARLSSLQELIVSDTSVSDLSPLARLSSLQKLIISDTSVSDLSPLAGLCSLQKLIVSRTPVSDLSPLVSLVGLQRLDISNTKVSDLSPLASLGGLQRLNVRNTKVSDLSPLIGLIRLQRLDLDRTPVSDLSPLAGLIGLQILDVCNTKVSDLAPLQPLINIGLPVLWEFESEKSKGIYVRNCPLHDLPATIAMQGNAAIVSYFREKHEQGVDHLYEAKLLLVGEGRAGKTSLLRRLYQPKLPLPKENETTKGIAIYLHKFKVQDASYPNGRSFRLNVWDFGGQEIYHATHQFFLTQRSLYVLLDDTSKDYKTVHDEGFKYWLEVVDLLSNHSPVLIFQNEKGDRSKEIDLTGIKSRFNVKELYKGNLEQKDSSNALSKAIEFYAQGLQHIGEELPAQWLKIRADIELRAQQQATISLQDYFKIYEKYLPPDRSKALHLSRYLHDLGVFLHFQDNKLLTRTIILQNNWATEAVFKILDDKKVKTQLGRFTVADCERLWQDSEYADMHPELLVLMQKFELCYPLPDNKPDSWLVSQLLPPSKPAELSDWAKAGDLVLRYDYEFLPKGLISRLIVRQHRFVLRPKLGWRTGVLFERDNTEVLVEIPPKGGEIMLRARGFERKELLTVITTDLDALNETFFKGQPEKVTKLVPCYCKHCCKQTEPEFFKESQLLHRKKHKKLIFECPASFERISVLTLLDGIQTIEMPSWSQEKKRIFISYSKFDNNYKETLLKHLAGLRDKIVTWNDRDIMASEEWDARIKEELHKADVVVYLVSPNSIATDYIQNVELPLIEARCRDGECKLIPVIVDFCDWKIQDFAKYNVLPDNGVPVTHKTHWNNENEAWLAVEEGIKLVIKHINGAILV